MDARSTEHLPHKRLVSPIKVMPQKYKAVYDEYKLYAGSNYGTVETRIPKYDSASIRRNAGFEAEKYNRIQSELAALAASSAEHSSQLRTISEYTPMKKADATRLSTNSLVKITNPLRMNKVPGTLAESKKAKLAKQKKVEEAMHYKLGNEFKYQDLRADNGGVLVVDDEMHQTRHSGDFRTDDY